MARKVVSSFIAKPKVKRKGVHSKNASKGQKGYSKKYRGQGRN
tara:strand:+ start:119 stop:247 length:129 start_codon:yes stop_codon:yes gene_type:complete